MLHFLLRSSGCVYIRLYWCYNYKMSSQLPYPHSANHHRSIFMIFLTWGPVYTLCPSICDSKNARLFVPKNRPNPKILNPNRRIIIQNPSKKYPHCFRLLSKPSNIGRLLTSEQMILTWEHLGTFQLGMFTYYFQHVNIPMFEIGKYPWYRIKTRKSE